MKLIEVIREHANLEAERNVRALPEGLWITEEEYDKLFEELAEGMYDIALMKSFVPGAYMGQLWGVPLYCVTE